MGEKDRVKVIWGDDTGALIQSNEFFVPGYDRSKFLSIHVLNQGNGDAIIIECPPYRNNPKSFVIIDGGKSSYGRIPSRYFQSFLGCPPVISSVRGGTEEKGGENTIKSELRTVVMTHPHRDHDATLPWFIRSYHPRFVFLPLYRQNYTRGFIKLLNDHCRNWQNGVLAEEDSNFGAIYRVEHGEIPNDFLFTGIDEMNFERFNAKFPIFPGNIEVKVLQNTSSHRAKLVANLGDINDCSVTCSISYPKQSTKQTTPIRQNRMLFPGDLCRKGWDSLIQASPQPMKDLKCNVLKVSHHGNRGTYVEVLECNQPDYAIITTSDYRDLLFAFSQWERSRNFNLLRYGSDRNGTWGGTNRKTKENPNGREQTYLTSDGRRSSFSVSHIFCFHEKGGITVCRTYLDYFKNPLLENIKDVIINPNDTIVNLVTANAINKVSDK